eukprot:8116768-Alexandrium_andersonii.AAC.1
MPVQVHLPSQCASCHMSSRCCAPFVLRAIWDPTAVGSGTGRGKEHVGNQRFCCRRRRRSCPGRCRVVRGVRSAPPPQRLKNLGPAGPSGQS